MSFSVRDRKIRYRGTKLAKTKEVQPKFINFALFGNVLKIAFLSYFTGNCAVCPQTPYFYEKCCNWSKVSLSVRDCKIRYRHTKLAKTKELQLVLINFGRFGEKFSKSRFWAILLEILLLVPKQLLFDCKCCKRSKESVYTISAQFGE